MTSFAIYENKIKRVVKTEIGFSKEFKMTEINEMHYTYKDTKQCLNFI